MSVPAESGILNTPALVARSAILDRFTEDVAASRGLDLLALEPMTAPTNALVSGRGLRLVKPGAKFSTSFRIRVTGN